MNTTTLNEPTFATDLYEIVRGVLPPEHIDPMYLEFGMLKK